MYAASGTKVILVSIVLSECGSKPLRTGLLHCCISRLDDEVCLRDRSRSNKMCEDHGLELPNWNA